MDAAGAPDAAIASIQVGLPRDREDGPPGDGRPRAWRSAIWKQPVGGPVWLDWTGLDGDGQADLVNHGGPDKAVLAYAAEHYRRWRSELDRDDLGFGAFGENLTVAGLDETHVCLGDTYAIGEARVQVSQPRRPCWKLARRLGLPDAVRRVTRNGRSGWYLRVLERGTLSAGQGVELLERPRPEWPVDEAARVMDRRRELEARRRLASVPELAASWRAALAEEAAAPPG